MDSSTGSPNHNSLSVGGPPPINFSHDLLCPPDRIGTALTVAGTRSYNQRMEPYSSFLTWRFDTALQFASGLHHQQARKGVHIPYIAHLMSVCSLVLEAGGDEDQAIAALLHDAVEDQGGLSTLDTIRHMFGDRVASTVESCSDSTATDPTEKPPWRERKVKYLQHLRTASGDALLVSAADKLHNARAILADYRELGEVLWSRFNAPKEEQLWYYGALVETLRQTSAPKTLVDELSRVVEELKRSAK
jgi:(p)ppGpp synthase/HD superfamily hydrolase